MGVTMSIYAQDNTGRLPIPYANTLPQYHSWPTTLAHVIDPSVNMDSQPSNLTEQQQQLFRCPRLMIYKSRTTGTSYAMNARSAVVDGKNNFSRGMRIDDAPKPSQVIVVTGSGWSTSGWFTSTMYSRNEMGFYHDVSQTTISSGYEHGDGTTSGLLLDMHSTSMTWDDVYNSPTNLNGRYRVSPFEGG
jgi:hypothetical protein